MPFFRVNDAPFFADFFVWESTADVFLPGGVFQPCDHGLDFGISFYVRIQSIIKSVDRASCDLA